MNNDQVGVDSSRVAVPRFRSRAECRYMCVQDQDTGDVGDFLKLGLLRWLVSPSPYGQEHRLGMVSFREPSEPRQVDDEQAAFLDPESPAGQDLRSLDSVLYDKLRMMASGSGHPLTARESCGALPKSTVCFDRPLSYDDLIRDDPAARAVCRQRWFHEAMVAVSACSLVFLDSDHTTDGQGDDVSLPEIGRLLERGQSMVTHHIPDPSQPLPDLVISHMNAIHEALDVEPLAVVRGLRGCTRLFTVIPHRRHRSDLQDRIGALQLSNWGEEFRVYRWHPQLVNA